MVVQNLRITDTGVICTLTGLEWLYSGHPSWLGSGPGGAVDRHICSETFGDLCGYVDDASRV